MWAPRSIEPLSGLNESFCGLWRFLYQPKSREPSQTSIHDYLQVGQKSSPIKHPLFSRGWGDWLSCRKPCKRVYLGSACFHFPRKLCFPGLQALVGSGMVAEVVFSGP